MVSGLVSGLETRIDFDSIQPTTASPLRVLKLNLRPIAIILRACNKTPRGRGLGPAKHFATFRYVLLSHRSELHDGDLLALRWAGPLPTLIPERGSKITVCGAVANGTMPAVWLGGRAGRAVLLEVRKSVEDKFRRVVRR